MSNIKINDVPQRIQYAATTGQTQFTIPFPFFQNSFVIVWQDGIQIFPGASPGQYLISGAGSPSGGLITLVTPALEDSIITIEGQMPIDRTSIYSATISNLTGSDLNGDFNREVVMLQQLNTVQKFLQLQYAPWALVSQDVDVTVDRYIPQLLKNQVWAMNGTRTEIIGYNVPEGGGLAPSDATYLIQTANPDLPNAQIMGSLASGFVVNTTTTGVQLTREFEDTANQIVITNQDGLVGNPAWSIAPNVILPGVEGMGLIRGTTAQRPVTPGSNTFFRFNTDDEYLEYWDGANWIQIVEDAGVIIIHGTTNQIDVDSTNPAEPILSLSANLDAPGTFTIQGSVSVNEIINDDTLATATNENLATALSIKNYVDGLDDGNIKSITGTTNQVLVDNTDPQNPILSAPQDIAPTSAPTFANITLTSGLIKDSNGNNVLGLTGVSSAVNYVSIRNAASGNDVAIMPQGTDNNIAFMRSSKGDAPLIDTSEANTAQYQFISGSSFDHITEFNYPTSSATRSVTWQDSDGTVAWLSDIPSLSGYVQSVTGTADEINVDNTDPQNPIISLPSTLIAPGTAQVGNLLLDTNTISSLNTNGDINLLPDGTGHVNISGMLFPNADGAANYFLQTDGAGNLSWSAGGVTAYQVQSSAFNIGVDSGTANDYVVTLSPAPSALNTGFTIQFVPLNDNTSDSVTIDVNGLGAQPAYTSSSQQLNVSDIASGVPVIAQYQDYGGGSGAWLIQNAQQTPATSENVAGNQYNYANDGGVVNAYTANPNYFWRAGAAANVYLRLGSKITLAPANSNTSSSCTLNYKGQSAMNVILAQGANLASGDIVSGRISEFEYGYAAPNSVSPVSGWILKNPATGKLTINVQRLVSAGSSGTYTPTPGTQYIEVEMVGGGGGSGGVTSTSSSITTSDSGGSGGYLRFVMTKSQIGSSLSYTVGAAGTRGTNAPTSGGDGGNSVFGSWTAAGGFGSSSRTAPSMNKSTGGPNPNTTGTGQLISNMVSYNNLSNCVVVSTQVYANVGASTPTPLSYGGASPLFYSGSATSATSFNAVPSQGYGYGAVGVGAVNGSAIQGALPGGGAIIIREYIYR